MKVLLVGPFPLPLNGCSIANKALLEGLQERGIQFSFIDTNTKTISGNQGHHFSLRKMFDFLKKYLNIFKLLYASVVYVTPGQTFFGVCKYAPFFLLCKILGKPYVIHLHGGYLGKEYETLTGLKRRVFYFCISGAAAGIALSNSLSSNFDQLLPIERISIVGNFVSNDIITVPLHKQSDKLRVLYLSNLMHEKGIIELLDSLLLLKQQNVMFSACLAGAIEAHAKAEVEARFELLRDELQYVGVVDGKRKTELLMNANVIVLPTYYKMEGQPICLLEGMATGNIVITTAHAGIPDVINQTNGFFVEKRSAQCLFNHLRSVSEDLNRMISTFSLHNRSYVAEKFTETIFVDKILTILYAVSKPKPVPASSKF